MDFNEVFIQVGVLECFVMGTFFYHFVVWCIQITCNRAWIVVQLQITLRGCYNTRRLAFVQKHLGCID